MNYIFKKIHKSCSYETRRNLSAVGHVFFRFSLGGLVLDMAIHAYQGMAAFQPVIYGVGGNLAGVESSRLSTHLHKNGEFGRLPAQEEDKVCVSPWSLYLGKGIFV